MNKNNDKIINKFNFQFFVRYIKTNIIYISINYFFNHNSSSKNLEWTEELVLPTYRYSLSETGTSYNTF